MRRKMFFPAVLAALLTIGVVSPPATAFSDWVGVYAIIDKVIVEPASGTPERIQLWGDFATATQTNRITYEPPQRGYLYFTVKAGKEDLTRKEWADLKALAGSGQVVGFGVRSQPVGRVRKSDEKPAAPDAYPIGSGLVKMSDRGSSYEPIAALKSLPRPKGSK